MPSIGFPLPSFFPIILAMFFASVAWSGCGQSDQATNADTGKDSTVLSSDNGQDAIDTLASNHDAGSSDATLDIPAAEPDTSPDIFIDPYPGVGHTWVVNLNDGTWVRPREQSGRWCGSKITPTVRRTATVADLSGTTLT